MSRTFLAFDLPAKLKARLSEEANRLRLVGADVNWAHQDSYHVTVRFLGELATHELQVLDPLVRGDASGVGPLQLVAKGLGVFPDEGAPRVAWCGVSGADESTETKLTDLKKRLDHQLALHGYRREKGSFHPHVTLGRVRSPRNAEALKERMGPSMRREFGHFVARELVLFESAKTREGVRYVPLQSFAL